MKESEEIAWWFVFFHDQLLLRKTPTGYAVPCSALPPVDLTGAHVHEVKTLDGLPCRAASLACPIEETDHYAMMGLRASYDHLPLPHYQAAGKARQIVHWDSTYRFCPTCAVALERTTPICKRCPSCGQEFYPVIHPAIIVLIRRGDSILLVHARNFRGTFHGLVAGFLETGETLEECVEREVMEETGLSIRNIRYFGSQPWPYPSGLMVGFTADYAGGEIRLQDEELSTGAFFTKDNLPEIPKKLSIARRLIDWWLAGQPER